MITKMLHIITLVLLNVVIYSLETIGPIVAEEVLPSIDRIAVVTPQQVSVVPNGELQVFVTAVVSVGEYDFLSKEYREALVHTTGDKKNMPIIVTYTCNKLSYVPENANNRPIMQVGKEYYAILRYNKESGSWTPYKSDHWSVYIKDGMDEKIWSFWNALTLRL